MKNEVLFKSMRQYRTMLIVNVFIAIIAFALSNYIKIVSTLYLGVLAYAYIYLIVGSYSIYMSFKKLTSSSYSDEFKRYKGTLKNKKNSFKVVSNFILSNNFKPKNEEDKLIKEMYKKVNAFVLLSYIVILSALVSKVVLIFL